MQGCCLFAALPKLLVMKLIVYPVFLIVFCLCAGGLVAQPRKIKGEKRLLRIQSTTLIIPVDDPESEEARYLAGVFEKNWTVTEFRIVPYVAMLNYLSNPEYTLFLEYFFIADGIYYPRVGLIQGGRGCENLRCGALSLIMNIDLAFDKKPDQRGEGATVARPAGHLYELFIRHFNNTLCAYRESSPDMADNGGYGAKVRFYNNGEAELAQRTVLFSLEDIGPDFDQSRFDEMIGKPLWNGDMNYKIVPPEEIARAVRDKDERYAILYGYEYSRLSGSATGTIYSTDTGLRLASLSSYKASGAIVRGVLGYGFLAILIIGMVSYLKS